MPDEIAPAVDECCDDLLEGDPHGSRFYQSAPQPIEKRHPMTAWIIGAFAFWIAEILVFEQWGYVTSVKLIGAAIAISGPNGRGPATPQGRFADRRHGTFVLAWGQCHHSFCRAHVRCQSRAATLHPEGLVLVHARLFRGREGVLLIACGFNSRIYSSRCPVRSQALHNLLIPRELPSCRLTQSIRQSIH